MSAGEITLTRQKAKQRVPDTFVADQVDWRLIEALQDDARASWSELGRRVGLTPPAVAERVRRLEDAGIIAGYHSQVSVEKLGLTVQALVRVAVRSVAGGEIRQAVLDMPEVLECFHVTGEDCYVLRVAVPSMGQLEGLLERLLRFGSTTTSVVISTPVTRRTIRSASGSLS